MDCKGQQQAMQQQQRREDFDLQMAVLREADVICAQVLSFYCMYEALSF